MIKINLLKTFLAVDHGDGFLLPDDEKKQITIDFVKRVVMVILLPAALYFYEGTHLPQLQSEIAAIKVKLADLKQFNEKKKNLAEEIKKYEEDQKRLNAQMAFMRMISNEKVNELNFFLFLQESTPESVWVNRIELRGADLTLNAESDVPTDINKFIDRLATAPLLTGVSPTNQETKFDTIAPGVSTTIFNVKASFAVGAPAQ